MLRSGRLGRQGNPILLRNLAELVVRLAVVGDHRLPELLDLRRGPAGDRHVACINLGHSAGCCLTDERLILVRKLAADA